VSLLAKSLDFTSLQGTSALVQYYVLILQVQLHCTWLPTSLW